MTIEMTCAQTSKTLKDCVDTSLSTEERDALEQHLVDCPECAAVLQSRQNPSIPARRRADADRIPERARLRDNIDSALDLGL
jgi:anti-sigma factor RsiW